MAKKDPYLIAIKNGKGYLPINAACAMVGMHTLVIFADGLPITFFNDEEQGYMDFETLAEWAYRESRYGAETSRNFRRQAAFYCWFAAAAVASGQDVIAAPGDDYVRATVEWLEGHDRKTAKLVKKNRPDLFKTQPKRRREAAA